LVANTVKDHNPRARADAAPLKCQRRAMHQLRLIRSGPIGAHLPQLSQLFGLVDRWRRVTVIDFDSLIIFMCIAAGAQYSAAVVGRLDLDDMEEIMFRITAIVKVDRVADRHAFRQADVTSDTILIGWPPAPFEPAGPWRCDYLNDIHFGVRW